jgi:Uma2 family endonuclease
MADMVAFPRMDADEFVLWAERQPGRYELEDGRVLAQANERADHVRVKGLIYRRLLEAVERAGVACEVYADGLNLRVDAGTVYCPDATLRCGAPLAGDALEATDPTVLVEVTSSSSEMRDTVVKLMAYFRIASLRHYLVVRSDRALLLHHARGDGDTILTRIVAQAPVRLDPPGIVLEDWWAAPR